MTAGEPHSAGFRTDKETGQYNSGCIIAFQTEFSQYMYTLCIVNL